MLNLIAIRPNGLTVTAQVETFDDAVDLVTKWTADPWYGLVADSPVYFAGPLFPLKRYRADEFNPDLAAERDAY